jgi:hypothetical protein
LGRDLLGIFGLSIAIAAFSWHPAPSGFLQLNQQFSAFSRRASGVVSDGLNDWQQLPMSECGE